MFAFRAAAGRMKLPVVGAVGLSNAGGCARSPSASSVSSSSPSSLIKAKPIHEGAANIQSDSMSPPPPAQTKCKVTDEKILVAFDFDKTIVDVNSDEHVMKLLPEGGKEVEHLFHQMGWNEVMSRVFYLMHEAGVRPADVLSCLREMKWTPGMKELVQQLKANGHDVIIISDSNSVFINYFLNDNEMLDCFQEVFTNPAEFDCKGLLRISMFHRQNWCDLCAKNLCKGTVLRQYIEKRKDENTNYKFVAYVGDGKNDYCPMLRLGQNDLAFPRLGYSCHNIIVGEKKTKHSMAAKVVPWENGTNVQDAIFNRLK